jgi:hypothetical protein
MNKKILATLLIAAISVTGLFAGKSAILNANKPDSSYTFVIQYNNVGTGDTATAAGLTLDSTERITPNAFSIETGSKGNVSGTSTFTTTVTTAAFTGVSATATETTTAFPFIVYTETEDKPTLVGQETFSYTPGTLSGTKFESASTGTYVRSFNPGVHFAGTVIAQFKLSIKGNDDVVAGDYTSTSTIEIATT